MPAKKAKRAKNVTPKSIRSASKDYRTLKQVVPRSYAQEDYLTSIEDNIVTFGIGPAGTGKTYLAVSMALAALWGKKASGVNKIVLTRPVVEAGEKLGFLPGGIDEKLDPYMRPLYDAMHDVIGIEATNDKVAKGVIEIAPVAYMRGRTFHDCFIILDEAQNCSYDQIKMVLTRLGENTTLVICGDGDQTDLPGASGLLSVSQKLTNVEGIGISTFTSKNVERSAIVGSILEALDDDGKGVQNGS